MHGVVLHIIGRLDVRWVPAILVCIAALRIVAWQAATVFPEHCNVPSDLRIQGRVLSMDVRSPERSILDVAIHDVEGDDCLSLLNERVRLALYHRGDIPAADSTLLTADVRIKPPWGSANPGGFDYRRWLLGKGFRADGYIRQVVKMTPVADHSLPDLSFLVYPGILQALSTGDHTGITSHQWEVFRSTGTIHLMVISGLHVGIVAALVLGGIISLMRLRPPGFLPFTHRRIATLICSICLVLFVWNVGFQPPVVRAAAAVIAAGFLMACERRPASLTRCVFLIGLCALIAQPGVVYRNGFWLSYGAVFLLLAAFGNRERAGSVTWVVKAQGVLFIGLTPWLLFLNQSAPVVSLAANLVAAPLVTLITMPSLVAAVLLGQFTELAAVFLTIADFSIELLMHFLDTLIGRLPLIQPARPETPIIAAVSFLSVIAPVSWRYRVIAILGWLTLFLPVETDITHGQYRVTALDVGQGNSAIVDTANHRILVDAGAAMGDFDAGLAIVLPAIRATGRPRIDRILISHGDNDHSGGFQAVAEQYPLASHLGYRSDCNDGDRWEYDGVSFELLQDSSAQTSNDGSCMLVVRNCTSTVFFPGDISVTSEQRMHARLPRNVDVLLAPHHGSATSSSMPFVRKLNPRFVIFSAARFNRWGHPDSLVERRYLKTGAVTKTTGIEGAFVWTSENPDWLVSGRGRRFVALFEHPNRNVPLGVCSKRDFP